MESVELHDIGTRISDAFELLGTFQDPIQLVGQRILGTEAQRFKLWAHSLGLHQLGHASLDYWVRDATVVKDRLADFLADMLESLTCLLEIARHERLPYEQDITVDEASSEDLSSTDSLSEASHESGSSAPSSEQSFHEVPFRLQCITESLDALYSLATRIRNPKNRPQRSNDQLYKDVPIGVRAAYIKEREQVETAIVACIQREVLLQGYIPDKEGFFDRKALLDQYASETYWLVRRTGIANARRKQQLIYWKGHAIRLSQLPDNRPPMRATRGELEDQPVLESRPIDLQQINPPTVSGNEEQSDPALGPSLATSATKLPPDFVVLDDLRSVISYHSCVSTVMDLQGRKLEWPPPPAQGMSSKHFMCPYCETLCPQRYLSRELWQVHLMHDLQPYHCTYEDCNDHQRLYGTRQEWIDHECQHSRVWHCEEHSKEFETQKEYVEHLKEAHPQNTAESFAPELIAAAVGHSLYPRRDCPFCPTPFETVKEMQKHIAYHLEKLALRVFPRGGEDSIEESNSGFSNTMTSPILEIPAFSPEEGILESFTSHMLKQWTGEAVGGRTYVRTRRMINWMRTSESKEGMANGGLLLEAVYEAARKPSSEFLPIEWEQISSDNCIIMFGLLTVLGYGHLIDVFARNGIQRYLRKAGFILEKHILTDHFQSPDSAEDFMLAFERRRWEFSPVEFNLGMDIVLGDHRCVLPFCHKQRINHKGATAELFEVAVEEDFVHETLRVAIQGSRYNDSVYGLCYRFAFKSYSENRQDLYKIEKNAFNVIVNQQDIIKCLGTVECVDDQTSQLPNINNQRRSYNILLEYGEDDLNDYFIVHSPPTLGREILDFWEKLFQIADALRCVHNLEKKTSNGNSIKRFQGCHADVKPDNILRVQGSFKLADFGLATFVRSHEGSISPVGGTDTYAAPELLQMPRKLPNDGNACAVTNTIDTWSFACVISVAATWLMLGLEGIKQFQMLRRAVIKTIPYPFLSDDAFHDGSTVLDVVTDWHKYLRRIVRTSDPISHRLLDLIDHEVLGRDPDSRLTTAALYNKLMDLLVVAKSELDEQIAESIVNRMISFDKTSLSNGGSHHEGAPNDNLSVESGRPASASKLQEHSPNPLNPLRISTITNAVDIPIYKAYSSLQSENQFKFVTIFRHKEDQYVSHFIKGRDIKFIVDNGSSMKKHWENVTATLLVLAQRVVASDEDGVDLVFTFADNKLGCRNVKDPWAKFSKAMRRAGGHISTDPQNPLATDMAKTLGEVFQEYERQRTKKRTTLIILTDGIWGGSVQPNEVEQKIADFFKGYKRTNSFEDRSFTIQFVSFGDQAIDKFDVLDDDMGKKYGIRDVIDHEPWTGDPDKMVLGSVVQPFDTAPTI